MGDLTRNSTLPDSAEKTDFYNLVDTATVTTVGGETASNVADAVSKKHTQNTDQYLDYGGSNQVSVADVKDAVDKKHTQNTDHIIKDADSDTYLDVEETSDADTIVGKVKGVEAFRIHNNGIVDLPKQSKLKAYLNSNITISDSTDTVVKFDNIVTDTQNEYDSSTGKFTATKHGFYFVSLRFTYYPSSSGIIEAKIHKNGVSECLTKQTNHNTDYEVVEASTWVELNDGDYLEFIARQTSGGNLNILGLNNAQGTNVRVIKVA